MVLCQFLTRLERSKCETAAHHPVQKLCFKLKNDSDPLSFYAKFGFQTGPSTPGTAGKSIKMIGRALTIVTCKRSSDRESEGSLVQLFLFD